jgi:hypothetical protein
LHPAIERPTSSKIKVLGIRWHTKKDQLSLFLSPTDKIKFDRIGITNFVTGIFDPLRFANPSIVKAKIQSRELPMLGLTWEGTLHPYDQVWWKKWIHFPQEIQCLFSDERYI